MTSKVKLTDPFLQKLKTSRQEGHYMDITTPGLGIRVSPKGKIAFYLYTKFPGDTSHSRKGLGEWCPPEFTLAKAREKAVTWKGLIIQGINPIEELERRKAEEAKKRDETFASVVPVWQASLIKAGRRPASTNRRVKDHLERHFLEKFGHRSILELCQCRGEIRQHLKSIQSPATAKNVHCTASSVFSWAIKNELYGMTNAQNPCHGITEDQYGYRREYDTETISDEQIAALWKAADDAGYQWGPFLKFVALTVGRHSESMLAQWSEIDFDKKLWTIPKEHAKNKQQFIKPLSNAAIELLASLPRDLVSALAAKKNRHQGNLTMFERYYDPTRIFGLRPLSINTNSQSARPSTPNAINRHLPENMRDWGFHRFRHTFKTCMASNSKLVVREAVEMYLSHGHEDEMENFYNMHKYQEEMREVAELWAQKIERILNPAPPNIIQFKKPA